MKHLILLALTSSLIPLPSSLFAAEVVVYSPPSGQPLHVSGGGVTRTFPASYTGHRAVCEMPGAGTNDTFVAWAGGDAFTPGDLYGTSAGRELPQIELTRTSPVTPRIDIFGKTADRVRMIDEIYTNIVEKAYADFHTPIALSNRLAQLSWMDTNRIESPTFGQGEEVRVRVVRWLVDGWPLWYLGIEPRVVVDKKFNRRAASTLTESNILTDGEFDLDWAHFQNEVMDSIGVSDENLDVNEVDYLVVIGDGVTSWRDGNDSNVVVKALSTVVSRHYGTNHVQAVTLPSDAQPLTHPVFRFRADCPELEGYTACELQVMSGSVTNWTTGTVRMPPRDATGAYTYSAPDLTGMVSPETEHTWRVILFNSKYSSVSTTGWSAPVPVIFDAQE